MYRFLYRDDTFSLDNIKPPFDSHLDIVDIVIVVAEIGCVQTHLVIAHREIFKSESAIEIACPRHYHPVIRFSLRIDIPFVVAFLSEFSAYIPLPYAPDYFADDAVIGEKEILLAESGAVENIHVNSYISENQMIA